MYDPKKNKSMAAVRIEVSRGSVVFGVLFALLGIPSLVLSVHAVTRAATNNAERPCVLPADIYYQSDRGVTTVVDATTAVRNASKAASRETRKTYFHACLTTGLAEEEECVEDSFVTQEIFSVGLGPEKKLFQESIHLIVAGAKVASAHGAYIQTNNADPSPAASVGEVCYDVASGPICPGAAMCIQFLSEAHRPRRVRFHRTRP